MIKKIIGLKYIQKGICICFLIGAIVLWPILAQPATPKGEFDKKLLVKVILQVFKLYHYSKPKVDDKISEALFHEYLRVLDPNKYFFLQKDIDEFSRYKHQLDDKLKEGNVDFAFLVFKRLLTRVNERIQFIKKISKGTFDFSKDETLLIEREKSSWPKNTNELNEIWRKSVKNQLLIAKLGKKKKNANKKKEEKKEKNARANILRRYNSYYKLIKGHDKHDILEYYISSLTRIFDPHSTYMNWRTIEDFYISLRLSLQGIGAVLTTEDGYAKIVRIIPGGAADKQGKLKAGYLVTGVAQENGVTESIIDMPLSKAVQKIRGKKGTKVTLTVMKSLQDVPFKITIVRDKIQLKEQEAKSEVKTIRINGKDQKLGILSLPSFYRDFAGFRGRDTKAKSTVKDVRRLLNKMIEKDKIQGLVIDLRYNGGGSLEEAIDLTGLFIPSGPVVQIKDAERKRVRSDSDDGFFYKIPLIVLVNTFSASASEIFAAAIQDYNRGIVVGQNTYGKGTVQQIIELKRIRILKNMKPGAVKFTMAKFYRVTGASTQKKGVTPDIIFPTISDHKEYGEASLKHVMPWDEIKKLSYKKYKPSKKRLLANLKVRYDKRFEKNPEFLKLVEYMRWWKERKSIKTVPLSMEKRVKMKKENDAWYKKIEKIGARRADIKKKEKQEDLFLDESIRILKDMIELKK